MAGRLLILHDSPDYGGHEIMLLALLPGVVASGAFDRIAFAHPRSNQRLAAALAGTAPSIERLPWPFEKRRAEPYLRYLRGGYRSAVRRLIRHERPTTVLLIQGRIENAATAMLAVPRSVRLVGYIPMAHRLREMGRSGLGDMFRTPIYRRPDAFIVPSAAVGRQLVAAGALGTIFIAPNTVSPPAQTARDVARATLDLDPTAKVALFMGRLDPAQKGLDRLAAAIRRGGGMTGWTAVVVGDGPGRAMIEDLAATGGGRIVSVPWTDRPYLYLAAADVLMMPSRWEGLPLVVLEAMTYGVPVIGSTIDAFADMLPADHIIDWERDDLGRALDRVDEPASRARYRIHCEAYLAPLNLGAAQAEFVRGLTGSGA